MSHRNRSVQSRLFWGAAGSLTVVLLASGVAVFGLVRARLFQEFDGSLLTQAYDLGALFEQDETGVDLEIEWLLEPGSSLIRNDLIFEVWSEDGILMAATDERFGEGIRWPFAGLTESIPTPVRMADGRRARAVFLTVQPELEHSLDEEPGTAPEASAYWSEHTPETVALVVARPTGSVDRALGYLGGLLVVVWLGSTSVLVGVLSWLVRRGLRPVNEMVRQLEALEGVIASSRLSVPDLPSELLPVVDKLNELFGRVESAFQQERTLLSNVAHELRTPLAGIRTTLEVSLSRPREAATLREDMAQCLEMAQNLQSMTNSLLTMARIEAGQFSIVYEPVDLVRLFEECWSGLKGQAERREITMVLDLPGQPVRSDPEKLRIIVRNLLDNAVSYAEPGTMVRVTGAGGQGRTGFMVSNRGCSVDPGDIDRIFDRFWRGDPGRRSGAGHFGLGLPLCRQLVDLLGGTIEAECPGPDLFSVSVSFPKGSRTSDCPGVRVV